MSLTGKLRDLHAWGSEAARNLIEAPLYDLGIRAYALGVRVASVRNPKAAKIVAGHKELWSKLRREIDHDGHWIWVHAASLGEFEQGRPIMEWIRREHPGKKILLTFFSPSGYEVRKNYAGADCICYLPFDTARNARRFWEAVRPEMAVFVKYEFWRNALHELRRHNVPTYLVSAVFRPDQFFFKKRTAWYRYWLRCFTGIFVQDTRSRDLLASVGIQSAVAGDTRFDRVLEIKAARKHVPEVERFLNGEKAMTLVVGSSWPEDEAVYLPWLNAHTEVKVIVAPHEFDQERLERLRGQFKGGALLLSEMQAGKEPSGEQALIIDCFGLLSSLYAYGDLAYVGGGFGAGLHNINEAAVYGIPVIYGPNCDKFVEASELRESGGGMLIKDASEFGSAASEMLRNPAERLRRGQQAGDYIARKAGATGLIAESIFGSKT